jgi:hypothetical protein
MGWLNMKIKTFYAAIGKGGFRVFFSSFYENLTFGGAEFLSSRP